MSMLHAVAALMPKTPPLPSKAFQATTFDGVARTIYPFNSHAIGAASGTKKVILSVALIASASRTIASVTVDGELASPIVTDTRSNFFFYRLALYIVDVSTGPTANIIVTASGGCEAAAISVWAAYDLNSSTAVDSDTSPDFVSPFDIPSLTTQADGFLVAATTFLGDAAASSAWTNATERSDLSSAFSGAFSGNSAADATTSGAGVAVVVATTAGGFDAGLAVAASFR